jgi:superfamily II DNA or RNA helicase
LNRSSISNQWGTGRYIGEGFDDARLDTLFLTMPVSWKGTLVQYAGRLHRLHPGKTEVRIYDYVDREVPLFQRMFERRLRGYRAIGYARDERPLDPATRPGMPRRPRPPSQESHAGAEAAVDPGSPAALRGNTSSVKRVFSPRRRAPSLG